jgi:hypothetical protein
MTLETTASSAYPSVEVAIALAERSHSLPGSSPTARVRLAFVIRLGVEERWSAATRAAHALREVDWQAVERFVGVPRDRLQRLDPAVLLGCLCETASLPTKTATSTLVATADHPHERSR